MSDDRRIIQEFTSAEYKEGFVTDVEQEFTPKGLNEDIVRMISAREREALAGVVAVDAVFDSVSVTTTFRKTLKEKGIIFCSFSEAVKEHPDLVRKYLASVVPASDNFFAALNSAVFSQL